MCILVPASSLERDELIELVEFRYRLLEPIYNPCPDRSDAEAFKAAIKALAESSSLRDLVLDYCFPEEKAFSGQVLARLFLHRLTKKTVLNYAHQVASPPPWDDGTLHTLPTLTPQEKARQYWEAYRTQENPNLPPFERAMRALTNHAPDVPHPGEEHRVYSRILIDRLAHIHGEADAFPVIATFLREAGHLLDGQTGGLPNGDMASAQEHPTEETEPGSPAYDPDEASPEEPPLSTPDEPGNSPQGPGATPTPEVHQENPLLNRILEITAGETGDLARTRDCWTRLLAHAQKIQHKPGKSYCALLEERLDNPGAGERPQDILTNFLNKMRTLIDLPC